MVEHELPLPGQRRVRISSAAVICFHLHARQTWKRVQEPGACMSASTGGKWACELERRRSC